MDLFDHYEDEGSDNEGFQPLTEEELFEILKGLSPEELGQHPAELARELADSFQAIADAAMRLGVSIQAFQDVCLVNVDKETAISCRLCGYTLELCQCWQWDELKER